MRSAGRQLGAGAVAAVLDRGRDLGAPGGGERLHRLGAEAEAIVGDRQLQTAAGDQAADLHLREALGIGAHPSADGFGGQAERRTRRIAIDLPEIVEADVRAAAVGSLARCRSSA